MNTIRVQNTSVDIAWDILKSQLAVIKQALPEWKETQKKQLKKSYLARIIAPLVGCSIMFLLIYNSNEQLLIPGIIFAALFGTPLSVATALLIDSFQNKKHMLKAIQEIQELCNTLQSADLEKALSYVDDVGILSREIPSFEVFDDFSLSLFELKQFQFLQTIKVLMLKYEEDEENSDDNDHLTLLRLVYADATGTVNEIEFNCKVVKKITIDEPIFVWENNRLLYVQPYKEAK